MRRFTRALAAEAIKLLTLPAWPAAALGTVVLAAAISAALAVQSLQGGDATASARAADSAGPVSAAAIALRAVPFVQVGAILLGILPVAHEYAGRQLRMSLVAVPSRGTVLAAKTVAVAVSAALTGVVAMGAAWGAAALSLGRGEGASSGGETAGLAGAVLYLVLMAIFAHAAALLLRGTTPALTAVLGLVLAVSPVVAGLSEHARWLPDRAAAILYTPGAVAFGLGSGGDSGSGAGPGEVLGPGVGFIVALAWIAVVFAAGSARFHRSEP